MPGIKNTLLNRIKATLLNQVVYLDGSTYAFIDNTLQPTDKKNARIVVLSRHCYQETIQWYPVTKRSELIKIIRLQQQTASQPLCFSIGPAINNKTSVIWYNIHSLPESINAWLYLPETQLLLLNSEQGTLYHYQTLFSARTVFAINTVSGKLSAIKGGVIQSPQQFALSQGTTVMRQVALTPPEHIQRLLAGLTAIFTLPLAGFFNKKALKPQKKLPALQHIVWPASIVFSLYLLVISPFSAWQAERATVELRQLNRNAGQLLTQRNQIDSMAQRYQQLQDALPAQNNLLQLWQVLAPVYQQQVLITYINLQQQQVSLQIEAPSAAAALQLLMQQPGVTEAVFEGTVRRQRNQDLATVKFTLTPVLQENNG